MSDTINNRELAELDYVSGMAYKAIAAKYGVSLDTVKSWKKRYKWVRTSAGIGAKGSHTYNEGADNKKITLDKLNDKQELFCIYYIKLHNATKSYMKAYDASYSVATTNGPRLLRNARVQAYIKDLKAANIDRTMVTEQDIINKYIEIAFADATDANDGTVMSEYASGVSGMKVKLSDRMKALEFLQEHAVVQSAVETYKGIPANMVSPTFSQCVFDIELEKYREFVFPGGRGSTKSTFISLQIIDLIERNPEIHACILRQVAETLRGSVYQQILWAIESLGLSDKYISTVSPLEITKKSTGQKIFFRGADKPEKIKSIKVSFGYIGVLWFEELDQFYGQESVRKIEQSIIRGGDQAFILKSYNPPKPKNAWVNQAIMIPKNNRNIYFSNYLSVPEHWLGKPFIEEAEYLKETNPIAYDNEYMGESNGSGGNVFENLVIREVSDEEINRFDHILNGVDWGWYPDLFAFARCNYEPAQGRLTIFQEYTCNKQKNEDTANHLKEIGVTCEDLITCDSAENKSIADYKSYGLSARAAEKGPESRNYSYKWLQSLKEIVIDNTRCPIAASEFMAYEYERDKEGNPVTGYPDGNDHVIDAIRYATESYWKRRGQ